MFGCLSHVNIFGQIFVFVNQRQNALSRVLKLRLSFIINFDAPAQRKSRLLELTYFDNHDLVNCLDPERTQVGSGCELLLISLWIHFQGSTFVSYS